MFVKDFGLLGRKIEAIFEHVPEIEPLILLMKYHKINSWADPKQNN